MAVSEYVAPEDRPVKPRTSRKGVVRRKTIRHVAEPVLCTECGASNTPHARECSVCGEQLKGSRYSFHDERMLTPLIIGIPKVGGNTMYVGIDIKYEENGELSALISGSTIRARFSVIGGGWMYDTVALKSCTPKEMST